jgi:chemotaxis protein methyltransferase CheR
MSLEISSAELGEILQLILQTYGYDFTDYSTASLKRRIIRFMEIASIKTIFDLKYNLTNDKSFFSFFLETVTVNVTEMFRDPDFYRDLREKVVLKLSTYPIIKIWHAGCATGEEVFSTCILLYEHDLLSRSRIYATDINPANLKKAGKGIMSLAHMKEYTQNYIAAGGKNDFSSYYTAKYDNAIIRKDLKEKIIFSQHNLVTDQAFNEFHLICCRNVLIYFNRHLQNKVLQLFYDSMAPLSYLALGIKETLYFTDVRNKFETINGPTKIFRRKD